MNGRATLQGLLVAEGTSDEPLAEIVEDLFRACGLEVRISSPDYSLLGARVGKGLADRFVAGDRLLTDVAVVVAHRDVDNTDRATRLREMSSALERSGLDVPLVPVIPVRMTEAWLLLDEQAIRRVAGNPNGRRDLGLPNTAEVERVADPKSILRDAILDAAAVSGRRRDRLARRFDVNRRLLLESARYGGQLAQLAGWRALQSDVARVAALLSAGVERFNGRRKER